MPRWFSCCFQSHQTGFEPTFHPFYQWLRAAHDAHANSKYLPHFSASRGATMTPPNGRLDLQYPWPYAKQSDGWFRFAGQRNTAHLNSVPTLHLPASLLANHRLDISQEDELLPHHLDGILARLFPLSESRP